jgi:hypothetical protein
MRNYISDDQVEQPAVKALRKTKAQGDGDLPAWLQESTTLHLDS